MIFANTLERYKLLGRKSFANKKQTFFCILTCRKLYAKGHRKRRVVVESVYRKVQYFIYKRFLLQLLFVHNAARLLAIHQKKGRKSIKMIFLLSHKYLFFLILLHICKQAIVMTSFVQCFMVQFRSSIIYLKAHCSLFLGEPLEA